MCRVQSVRFVMQMEGGGEVVCVCGVERKSEVCRVQSVRFVMQMEGG